MPDHLKMFKKSETTRNKPNKTVGKLPSSNITLKELASKQSVTKKGMDLASKQSMMMSSKQSVKYDFNDNQSTMSQN